MLVPDLSITISQRRWACVLDPALVLSRFGVPLIQRLGSVVDLWIVRELWHILDNSRYFLEQPEALFANGENKPAWTERPDDLEITMAMKAWERIRMETDLRGLKLCWLNDCFSESLTPEGHTAELLPHFESLACTLDRHLATTGPMACAARDSIALAAALGTAFVLTNQTPERTPEHTQASEMPQICRVFANSFPCVPIDDDDPIADVERSHLRHLFVHAGMSNLLWSGLRLTVIHVAAPAASAWAGIPPVDERNESVETSPCLDGVMNDPWEGARALWYSL